MKKLLFFLLISVGLNAQFNYQAIVKDIDGNPVTNNQVKFKFSLMYQSSTATPVYEEEHTVTTPPDGVNNLSVGGGTVVNGTFSNIDWSQSVFMKEELDTGSGYQDMGTRKVASVPVAEYAKVSNISSQTFVTGDSNIQIGTIIGQVNGGHNNIAIGKNSLLNANGTSRNISIGEDSMKDNAGGATNVSIGSLSLSNNTSGNSNVSIGYANSIFNETGSRNVNIGEYSGYNNESGSNNVNIGYRANYQNQGSSSVNHSNITTLGANTLINGNSITNSTAIGANATVTSSNTIQLGNTDVTLVNTSGVVSATGFKGSGDNITLTESGTTITLLELIEKLKSEIKSLRSINLNLLGPIALYSMENNTSNTFPDYNGISNQITFDSNNMVIGSYAGIFDGSSSFINLGDYDFLGNDPATTNSFSISTWCYFTDLESTNNSIITKWDNEGGQKSWYFGQYDQNFQSNSRNLHFAHSDNDGNETLAFSNNFAVTENNWHHCVLGWVYSKVLC
jgi:hypothetical protein